MKESVYTALDQLRKWLTSQEPTKQFNKKSIILKNFLNEDECKRVTQTLVRQYPEDKKKITALVEDTFDNISPIAIYTHAQFQAISESVFTINNLAFSSTRICRLLKKSEFVFPHIISTGKEIEDYALIHTDSLHRKIIRHVSKHAHLQGQHLIIEALIKEYGIKNVLPVLPGEPGWAMFEGIRIFDLFDPIPKENNLYLTEKGYPNVANTSYGLLIGH